MALRASFVQAGSRRGLLPTCPYTSPSAPARSSRSTTSTMPLPTINVTIYSDLACPWCWVGYRRLSKAMASFAGRARVEPEWRAYLLDPHFPEQAKDIKVRVYCARNAKK